MPRDLHELPKLSDSISYLYIERAVIEQSALSVEAIRADGRIPIPAAALTVLFLGPGTSITHAAVKALADNGCMVIWCGEGVSRFYASGMGETRSAVNLIRQAKLCMDEDAHMQVVRRMYERRFPDIKCENLSLQQIRGMEGIRVRQAYKLWSKTAGVMWKGRDYKNNEWDSADPINRALSAANSVLYGICQAAIVSLGYSPGLGFIHTGKQLSFVYDIADLYKADITIPAAFETVALNSPDPEREVRIKVRLYLKRQNVLKRIPEDLNWIFSYKDEEDVNQVLPGDLWDDQVDHIEGGVNHAKGFLEP